MGRTSIKETLHELTKHSFIEITRRGNAAIEAALSHFSLGSTILIPAEGGWLSYRTIPEKLQLKIVEVPCQDAKINVSELSRLLGELKPAAFLYHTLGGYCAAQPIKEIYEICHNHQCLVIADVSGSIGTALCDGRYADILIGSFGRWKIVDAGTGGFISCEEQNIFLKLAITPVFDEEILEVITEKLRTMPQRITSLQQKRKKIISALQDMNVIFPADPGLVVLIKYATPAEKERIINYCQQEKLEWTECPRYIRINSAAISIEVKRL